MITLYCVKWRENRREHPQKRMRFFVDVTDSEAEFDGLMNYGFCDQAKHFKIKVRELETPQDYADVLNREPGGLKLYIEDDWEVLEEYSASKGGIV